MSDDLLRPVDAAYRRVSRRTLAKGAAWAVPTVMVAGVAPVFACSTSPTGSGMGDCYQSNQQFGFAFTLIVPRDINITLGTSMTDGYTFQTNHQPQFYFCNGVNAGFNHSPDKQTWNFKAGEAATISIIMESASNPWPTVDNACNGGKFSPSYKPTGSCPPYQSGSEPFTIKLSGTYASSGKAVAICITFPAGYSLPISTSGHCPSNEDPSYVKGNDHYAGTDPLTAQFC